jgi:hypothetical protein
LVSERYRPLAKCTLSWCLTLPPPVANSRIVEKCRRHHFQCLDKFDMAKRQQGDIVVRCMARHERCLTRLECRMDTESRFWDKEERSTPLVKDRHGASTTINTRPPRGLFVPLHMRHHHLHNINSQHLQRGPQPSQDTRIAVTCATTPSNIK